MPEPLIILDSHRQAGHTRRLLNAVFAPYSVPIIDLLEQETAPYDYTGAYPITDTFCRWSPGCRRTSTWSWLLLRIGMR